MSNTRLGNVVPLREGREYGAPPATTSAQLAADRANQVVQITDVAFREGASTNIEVLDAQRRRVIELRNEGAISDDVLHLLERELDLEDQRLEI